MIVSRSSGCDCVDAGLVASHCGRHRRPGRARASITPSRRSTVWLPRTAAGGTSSVNTTMNSSAGSRCRTARIFSACDGVGDEDAARPGVLQDEARLLPGDGRIDRHRHQPRGHDAQVGDNPFLARLGHDRDAVARLQPHVDQCEADGPDAIRRTSPSRTASGRRRCTAAAGRAAGARAAGQPATARSDGCRAGTAGGNRYGRWSGGDGSSHRWAHSFRALGVPASYRLGPSISYPAPRRPCHRDSIR